MTISTHIEALSKQLLAIAWLQTDDACEAHYLAHIALLRILRKDPDLDHFRQIVTTLKLELAARHAARDLEPAIA